MVKQIFANANHQIKNLFKNTYIFICDQYLVLFFIITTGIKLALFNAYIIKVGWPLNQYFYGLFFGFLTAAIIYSPLYFIKKQKKNSAIVMAFFISCLLLIDTVYFSYFSTLPTIGLLGSLGQVGDWKPDELVATALFYRHSFYNDFFKKNKVVFSKFEREAWS